MPTVKKFIWLSLAGGIVFWNTLASADNKQPSAHLKNKFDFYILATQWIPGWCAVGTGKSGADLDETHACQQQVNQPLMYHGLWPENNNGTYPADCSVVPELDTTKLSFHNPFDSYLSNSASFLNHEWSKHGTCSNYYYAGQESSNQQEYYQQVNDYFTKSISLYKNINLATFSFKLSAESIQQQIHRLNPQIPVKSILVMCDKDQDSQFLTGLWFCVNKSNDKFIHCPAALLKTSCNGTLLTR